MPTDTTHRTPWAAPTRLLFTGPSSESLSEVQGADLCLQKWAWKRLGAQDTGSRATSLGTLCHVGLAHYYGRMAGALDLFEPADAIDQVVALELERDPQSAIIDLRQTAQDIVAAYQAHYAFDRIAVHLVESEVALTLTGQVWHDGRWSAKTVRRTKRLDLVWFVGGRYFIVDHKTSAEPPGARKVSGYAADKATHFMYIWGQLKYGASFGGVYINFLGTTAPYAFKRVLLAPQPDQIRLFAQSTVDTIDRVEQLLASGRDLRAWPRVQHEQVCQGRYGRCEFYDRCHG